MPGIHEGQKSFNLELKLWMAVNHGCSELNPGLVQEQVLVASAPSFQPQEAWLNPLLQQARLGWFPFFCLSRVSYLVCIEVVPHLHGKSEHTNLT